MNTDRYGFSTGALEKDDYKKALQWIKLRNLRCVELSALRYEELAPLVSDLDNIDFSDFSYVSFHAPSSFKKDREESVICLLNKVLARGWNIIVHPDVIYSPEKWEHFGDKLLLENMDRRKPIGRNVAEMTACLMKLPRAKLCLDLAHARQLDTTLTLIRSFVSQFKDRIAEVHISELDSRCRHHVMSWQSTVDYRHFAPELKNARVIIESVLYEREAQLRDGELSLAYAAME